VIVYVDPTDGGLIEGSVPPLDVTAFDARLPRDSWQVAQPRFTGCPAMTDARTDGQPGTVGTSGQPKRALILGPWRWQMEWDVETLAANLELGNSRYELPGGGITTVMTTSDRPSAFRASGGAAVRLEDFCGWERYDTIILKTHGRTVCDVRRCLTSLSVGRFAETKQALREYAGDAVGVTFGTSSYGNLHPFLEEIEVEQCIERLERGEAGTVAEDICLEILPEAGHMEVTTDFFWANYDGGLKDRMIFISACQGMKGALARALRGFGESSGAILGFDKIIQTSVANRVLEKFAEWVGTGRAIDQDALRELNRLADNAGANAAVAGQILGQFTSEEMADVVPDGSEATRGSDIVSLHTKQGGPELVDGGRILIEGRPGDRAIDTLKLGARLSGVGEEGPDAYEIEILLGDEGLRLREYEWSPTDVEGAFEAEIEAVSPDLPDEPFDLEIRTPLPDAGGAISRWRYRGLQGGSESGAMISVGGQTWAFTLHVTSFAGVGRACLVDDQGIHAAGYVDDPVDGVTFSAHLLRDGRGEILVDEGRDPAPEWYANAERAHITTLHLVPDGHSQIDSIEFEESVVSGTATFIDARAFRRAVSRNEAYPSPMAGTFEINCAGRVTMVQP
jgi:hypothetical protein